MLSNLSMNMKILIGISSIVLLGIIYSSIKIKNSIIQSDPFEKESRKKLNFGHTFAHAIESYYLNKGTPILHGEAVFMGMILMKKRIHWKLG